MTETYAAVVDRIEDGRHVVLLLEDEGEVVDERVVPPSELPPDARHEGAVLRVELAEGDVTELTYDPETTDCRRERAQDRFDRLAERPPDDEEPD